MSLGKKVTLVVTPRERYAFTKPSLESIFQNSNIPFDLVYVDGGSPPAIRDYLAHEASQRGFRLIRTEHILTPNEARNIGVKAVTTPYLVFVDNDVLVFPEWLKYLVEAAEREGASIVGPTTLFGGPDERIVHMTGGVLRFEEQNGRRRFVDSHRHLNVPYEKVRDQLKPEPTEHIEFHCMLVRRDLFDRIGLLDEGLMSLFEHADICMKAASAGRLVFFEPRAMVNYIVPRQLEETDLPFFLMRWSDEWNRASVERMQQIYKFAPDDEYPPHLVEFGTRMREHALRQLRWPLGKAAGFIKYKVSRGAGTYLAHRLEDSLTSARYSQRAAATGR